MYKEVGAGKNFFSRKSLIENLLLQKILLIGKVVHLTNFMLEKNFSQESNAQNF